MVSAKHTLHNHQFYLVHSGLCQSLTPLFTSPMNAHLLESNLLLILLNIESDYELLFFYATILDFQLLVCISYFVCKLKIHFKYAKYSLLVMIKYLIDTKVNIGFKRQ